jgi:DNA-binding NtrC family response regulator
MSDRAEAIDLAAYRQRLDVTPVPQDASPPRLLAIDDEPIVLAALERFARRLGFDVTTSSDSRAAVADIRALKPDAVIVDLRMPEVNGLAVLRAINDVDPTCKVILMTGHATVDTAIEAVKLGALDYLSKPFDLARLRDVLTTVQRGIERRRQLLAADSQAARASEFHGLIGRSPQMQELFDTVRRLAPHLRTALILGETGTGKELVARALHKLGPRRDRGFVVFNCSTVVETLFETEFFGHTRGAFTGATDAKVGLFEHADGGTLFLDEIGELPLAMQSKLLRVIEYGEVQRVGSTSARRVDVRVIAATNRDLRDEVRHGRFRDDLYYRLNVVPIAVPPLRDRRSDIPYLAAAFIKEFAARFNKPMSGLTAGAEGLLLQAPWPGNVRELRNTLERACMLSEGRILGERDLRHALGGETSLLANAGHPQRFGVTAATELPRERIEQALQVAGGNKAAAARVLGISRRALYRRLDGLGIRD